MPMFNGPNGVLGADRVADGALHEHLVGSTHPPNGRTTAEWSEVKVKPRRDRSLQMVWGLCLRALTLNSAIVISMPLVGTGTKNSVPSPQKQHISMVELKRAHRCSVKQRCECGLHSTKRRAHAEMTHEASM